MAFIAEPPSEILIAFRSLFASETDLLVVPNHLRGQSRHVLKENVLLPYHEEGGCVRGVGYALGEFHKKRRLGGVHQ
jgi:hypothetical protein